ncbi:hypothetical protein ACQ4PT_066475 [Festuca glaucescens]
MDLEDDDQQFMREPELPELRRGLGPRVFRYSELAAATGNFASEREIGRGGFGPVYKGYWSEENRHVAIKVLSRELSVQGLKEFQAEVTMMSQLRHRNVVRILGWCGRQRGLALVYELMPGGSLDNHLYNPARCLTWPQSSRRPSAESDVYSFGVVLLEIACGRRPTPSRRPDQTASAALLTLVRFMYSRNVILDAADQRLEGEFHGMQMERLLVTGLWCAHHDSMQRPSVTQAVDALRSEDAGLPALGMVRGSGEIRALEGQAYANLSAGNSSYSDASTKTGYLTSEDSAFRFQEERSTSGKINV